MLHTLRRTRLSPPGAAEPLAPFGCWEPSIRCVNRASNLLVYLVSDGALPSGAADPRLPSVAGRAPPSVVGVMLHTRRRTRLSLPVQQSCRLPPVIAGAPHPTRQTAPRSSCKRDPPVRRSKAQLPSDAARVPHSTSAIVLLFQQHAGLASPTPQAAAPVVHRTSSPVALPPFHLPTPIHISPQQAYFGEQLTLALWPLSLAQASFGEFSGFGPCSGLGALPQDSKPKYAYYCYQIKCKGELVKWCFINKVREEHDQIINRFGTGATRLANHPNEHNAYIYIIDTACLPPSSDSPPQLLTPNLFHPSSGTGEFSGFGPCSGLGALPQDSKPKYAYYCYQIKCKGELVNQHPIYKRGHSWRMEKDRSDKMSPTCSFHA